MKVQSLVFAMLIGLLVSMLPVSWAQEEAKELFEQGAAALQKGNLEEAMQLYSQAALADTENAKYRNHFMLVRRVLNMRNRLEKETNEKKWNSLAFSLHNFYHTYQVWSEALALDKIIHERLNNDESVAMLAETQIMMEMNAETIQLLQPTTQTTLLLQTLYGLALAREGKLAEAKPIADKLDWQGEQAGCTSYFYAAGLFSRIGYLDKAEAALVSCLENSPAPRLKNMKNNAKECKDLANLAAGDRFAAILETASKIQESGCSNGKSCSECPKNNKCGDKSDGKSCSDNKKCEDQK